MFQDERVKGHNHESQVCVGLRTDHNIAAGCVRKPRWVLPAAMTCSTSRAGNTGFSLCHFPTDAAQLLPRDINHAHQTDQRVFRAWSFSQSRDRRTEERQTVAYPLSAGMGLCTLVSAGFF